MSPFKETKDGQTNYCNHTKDGSICDSCLGLEDKTKPEYCECKYPIRSRVGIKRGDNPTEFDNFDTCQQCAKHIMDKTKPEELNECNHHHPNYRCPKCSQETKPEEWKIKIQKDLDDGKFGMICSSETHFKNYIYPLIQQWTDEAYEEVKDEIIHWANEGIDITETIESDNEYKKAYIYALKNLIGFVSFLKN